MDSSPVVKSSPATFDEATSIEPLSANNAEITFEGQWEEDDLVALSGKPGHSFQKIQTSSPQVPAEVQRARKKLEVDFAEADFFESDPDLSESDLDGIPTPEELLTPDDLDSSTDENSTHHNSSIDLEWDNDTPVHQPQTEDSPSKTRNHSIWRTVVIGEKNYKLDLSSISPYKQILSHGGYYGEGLNAIVVFSACYLPDKDQKDYQYVMDNLFLYIVSTLDLLVAEDYMIIFFNGGCSRKNFPAFKWLKKCYHMIHRRLRKNLKHLIIVHPSWYIRILIGFFRPFISSKFSRKLKLVNSLHRLADVVPLEGVAVPDAVQQHDLKLQQSAPEKAVASESSQNGSEAQENCSTTEVIE